MVNPLPRPDLAQHDRPARGETKLPVTFHAPPTPPRPGVRVFPPPLAGKPLERPAVAAGRTTAFAPDHLPIRTAPQPVDPARRAAPFIGPRVVQQFEPPLARNEFQATTIFPPDQRRLFDDTSYPWSTTGRVDLPNGWGSGVLVGPRHLLCASHMMTWNPNNTAGPLTFTPCYFQGSAPFGNAGAIEVYFYRKVVGPNLAQADTEEDYVCVVLDTRLGDLCGWMGTMGYDPSWNGLADWDHIGYPGDLGGGAQPSFQGSVAVDNTFNGQPDEFLAHKADVYPGQSGGPIFGWFPGEPGPSVVGVQSGQNPQTNSAGGGNDIPFMVQKALADFP